MEKIKDIKIRKWYVDETIKNGWSVNILEMQIMSKLYERRAIAEETTNFATILSNLQSDLVLSYAKRKTN